MSNYATIEDNTAIVNDLRNNLRVNNNTCLENNFLFLGLRVCYNLDCANAIGNFFQYDGEGNYFRICGLPYRNELIAEIVESVIAKKSLEEKTEI